MANNINTKPSTDPTAVPVRTTEKSSVHIPHSFSEPCDTVSAANVATVGATAGQVAASAAARIGLLLQNCGTTKIYVLLGSGTPTTTSYHFALAPCDVEHDGTGGYQYVAWKGAVQAISSAAGGKLSVVELS